jgi:flagellar operon protein
MTEKISIGQLYPNAIPPAASRITTKTQTQASGPQFEQLLQQQFVRFSHHAEVRLEQRGIELKPEQLAKLESAIDKAAQKGAKDSLMFMNGMALIVNVPNRTVVTALDSASMKDHVFTQIDSAVIINE